jgi:hypothetical protein
MMMDKAFLGKGYAHWRFTHGYHSEDVPDCLPTAVLKIPGVFLNIIEKTGQRHFCR